MGYPNSWKEDRRARRAGGSQARPPVRRAQTGRTGIRPPLQPRLSPISVPGGMGARLASRFIPWVGIGILAVEVGWYWYNYSGKPTPWTGPAGWTYGGPCAGIGNPTFKQASFAGILHCFGGSTAGQTLGTPIPDNHTSFHLGYQFGSKIKDREWWFRAPGDFPGSVPGFPGVEATPIPLSPIRPGTPHDPMRDVPLEPSPQVHPDPFPATPYPRPKPRDWQSPTEGRQAGPAPQPRQAVEPRLRPYERPAIEIAVQPRPGPVTASPGSHKQLPPKGRGQRERKQKTKSAGAFNLIRRVFEGAFEAVDVIEAVFQALPQHIRQRYPHARRAPVVMMRAINRHWQVIDTEEMIINLLLNELEDYIFGRLGRMSQHVAQQLHLSTGPQFGGGARRAEVIAWRRRRSREAVEFLVNHEETFQ